MILTFTTSYFTHKYVLWANKGCSIILWYHPWSLLYSWPIVITLWATIATHLGQKMAENDWKPFFDDAYLHNLLFHTQIYSMGQLMVFNYPMVSPKAPTTIMTPYTYPMSHHSHSFVSQNGRKWLKTSFWWYLPPKPLIPHSNLLLGPLSAIQLPKRQCSWHNRRLWK
jgi:hypothetical protein